MEGCFRDLSEGLRFTACLPAGGLKQICAQAALVEKSLIRSLKVVL